MWLELETSTAERSFNKWKLGKIFFQTFLCILCKNSAWSTRRETVRLTGAELHTKKACHMLAHIMTSPHMHTYLPTHTGRSWKRPKEKESWVICLSAVRLSASLSTRSCAVWPCFKMLHFTCSDSPSFSVWKGHAESSHSAPLGKESLSW